MKNTILVVGGMHGNESLGLGLVRLLKEKPIKGVDTLIANPKAVKLNLRFVESDMNRSFGGQFAGTYETKRAVWLKRKAAPYKLVLDFHNTQAPQNNCCFVGEKCRPQLYEAAKRLGLRNCIQANYDCVNKACSNTLSVEISIGDKTDNAALWHGKIKRLAAVEKTKNELVVYTFLRRVTWEEKAKLGLSGWQPFRPISDKEKKLLGVSGIIVPIFVGSKLTEYWASLLTKKETL